MQRWGHHQSLILELALGWRWAGPDANDAYWTPPQVRSACRSSWRELRRTSGSWTCWSWTLMPPTGSSTTATFRRDFCQRARFVDFLTRFFLLLSWALQCCFCSLNSALPCGRRLHGACAGTPRGKRCVGASGSCFSVVWLLNFCFPSQNTLMWRRRTI